jgi:PAS domain S-box-containing protein
MSEEFSVHVASGEVAALREENRQLRVANERLSTTRASDLHALFDFMPELGWTARADGSTDFFNRAWYEYTGTTFEQMRDWGWETVHDPAVLPLVLARWRDSLRAGTPFEMEFPLRRHDGAFRWFLTRVNPVRNEHGAIELWVGINTDIDESRRAARAAEGLHEAIVRNMAEGVCLVRESDESIVYTNPKFDVMMGYAPGELIGQPAARIGGGEAATAEQMTPALLEQLQLSGVMTLDVQNVRKDGSRIWCRAHVSRLEHPAYGVAWVAVHEDVTDSKNDRERLDLFFEMSLDLLSIAGMDGHFVRLNPAWMALLGWSEEELLSRHWLEFVHPDDLEATVAAGRQLAAGSPLVAFTNRYVCRDGSYRWIEWRCVPALQRGLIYAAARDISARRRAEEARDELQRQLTIAERMVSVGTLAAGVAHEINNPLSYLTTNLEVALEELHALPGGLSSTGVKDLEEMLLEARTGADRVRKIVRGLQTFSRSEEERRVVVDVRATLELAINMTFNEIRHRARLVKDFGPIPFVEVDDAQLGQVFINLLVNAAQAIPEGNVDANEIRLITSTDGGGNAVVEVRDTGPGIPASVFDRIFDPFFTTKPIGVGTGLGLSICHNTVTNMGGHISVTSTVGAGTSFRVVLPAARVQRLPEEEGNAAPAAVVQRRASVLVVDDEPSVGTALRRILRDHDVTVVTTAREALRLVGTTQFDVILSDLMMPEMSGGEFYDELSRRSPADARRMVFVTGGAFTPAASEFLNRVPNPRFPKPFEAKAIRAVVLTFLK